MFKITLIALVFSNPMGSDNVINANSSQLYNGGEYRNETACDDAGKNLPVLINNTGKSEFFFTGTHACVPTVAPDDAGAIITLSKLSQNTGLQFQNDGQTVTLYMRDMGTCETWLDAFKNVTPVWSTDLPLSLYGACNRIQ